MQTDLIPQAVVIGDVGAAVYWTDTGTHAIRLERDGSFMDCTWQAGLLLDCPAEQYPYSNISMDELREALALWTRRQRVLGWLVDGINPDLPEETRRFGLELVERAMVADSDAADFVRGRLLNRQALQTVDTTRILRLAEGLNSVSQVIREGILSARDAVEPTIESLSELELCELIEKASKELESKRLKNRRETLYEIRKLAASIDIDVNMVKAPKRKGTKYRNPENLFQRWTGRGIKPKWLLELIESGHDINKLEGKP